MKKYIVLFVCLFGLNVGFAQPGGPPNACPCCDELLANPEEGPTPSEEADYTACINACNAGESPCAPIDSGILLLLALGTSLGVYKVYKNKKRQLEN
ncbi:PID-CTERM protein-sorting domain-containing protein [Flavobacterium sp. PLA-1-15]|uniref:PID-CTERM protein-sorting domain-containing protein n=1 Tax=Flavobacterium sp. PLA-1-15 TaxID=3380533 RepID=UPI003B783C8F